MRDLPDVPNIGGTSTAYPDGSIIDQVQGTTGTALTEILYGDLIQTVHKLKRVEGITPNGNPDNETNGFQMLDALLRQGLPQWYPPSSNVSYENIKFVQYNNGIYYHKTAVNTANNPTVDTTNWFRILYWNGTRVVFSNESMFTDTDTGWLSVTRASGAPSSVDVSNVRCRQINGVVFVNGRVILPVISTPIDIITLPNSIGTPSVQISSFLSSGRTSTQDTIDSSLLFQFTGSRNIRSSFISEGSQDYIIDYSYPVG